MRLPKIVQTEDGSQTFFNEEFDQVYHSKSGALEESFKKYVEPCNIQDNQTIVDFCFGLGYNSLAAIVKADNLTVYALEIDKELLASLDELSLDDISYEEDTKKRLIESFTQLTTQLKEHILAGETNFDIPVLTSIVKVRIGDAAQTILDIEPNSVDAVFWDPFSPKQHPQLWEATEFAKAYAILKQGGMLATYSYARIVRDGLAQVGFEVRDGPVVGRRCPSTLAFKPTQ